MVHQKTPEGSEVENQIKLQLRIYNLFFFIPFLLSEFCEYPFYLDDKGFEIIHIPSEVHEDKEDGEEKRSGDDPNGMEDGICNRESSENVESDDTEINEDIHS